MNSTNMNIRKVHNDRFDSKKAALVGLKPDLKVSLMPSDLALNCRNLCREYYDLTDNRSAYVNKLQGCLLYTSSSYTFRIMPVEAYHCSYPCILQYLH